MHIYIPTMRRPRLQYTLNQLKAESPYSIILAVPEDEVAEYTKCNPGASILAVPLTVQRIAATRMHIMEHSTDNKVLMMDDDLTFAVRRLDEPEKFRNPEPGELAEMLHAVDDLLNDYAHVGIATREGGNRNTAPVLHCTRSPRVIGYQKDTFFGEGVDFTNSYTMDDFEAALHLLTRGYESAVLNTFVQNQKGSGTAGGAATYRDLQMCADSANKLQSRYPQFVKTVQKTTKTAWGGATRTDVIVQWKKALAYGLKVRNERSN